MYLSYRLPGRFIFEILDIAWLYPVFNATLSCLAVIITSGLYSKEIKPIKVAIVGVCSLIIGIFVLYIHENQDALVYVYEHIAILLPYTIVILFQADTIPLSSASVWARPTGLSNIGQATSFAADVNEGSSTGGGGGSGSASASVAGGASGSASGSVTGGASGEASGSVTHELRPPKHKRFSMEADMKERFKNTKLFKEWVNSRTFVNDNRSKFLSDSQRTQLKHMAEKQIIEKRPNLPDSVKIKKALVLDY